MKHHKKGRTLGRKKGQRTALMRSLARSLIMHEQITTTVARAKELRPYVEKLITSAKKNTVASQRLIASKLPGSPEINKKLHKTFAARYANRTGGFVRIVKIGPVGKRVVDSAVIELVK